MKQQRIDTMTSRQKLRPKSEPYWYKFTTGAYIGYRRTATGGTWVARYRPTSGKYVFCTFGDLLSIKPVDHFASALNEAKNWITSIGIVSEHSYTVQLAINDYVEHLLLQRGKKAAHGAQLQLSKHIPDNLKRLKLSQVTYKMLLDWQAGLTCQDQGAEKLRSSKSSANRIRATFVTVLNLAYKKNIVTSDAAWRNLKMFPGVSACRDVYLTDAQIDRMFKNAKGQFSVLLKSALLTGARYGGLADCRVSDFNAREGTLRIGGKTGLYTCYLSDHAIEHFKTLSIDKLPNARLHIKNNGTRWKAGDQWKMMNTLKVTAKLPAKTVFYTLRHTHISKALLAGINIQVVAENCGTSIYMIEKHYAKFLKSDRRAMFNSANIC